MGQNATELICPSCGTSYEVTPDYLSQYAGMKMTCDCGEAIPVPGGDAPSSSDTVSLEAKPLTFSRGVWQDGDAVVVARGTRLPSRCAECNAKLAVEPKPQILTWTPEHSRSTNEVVRFIRWVIASSDSQSIVVRIGWCDACRPSNRLRLFGRLFIVLGVLALSAIAFLGLPKHTSLFMLGGACLCIVVGLIMNAVPPRIQLYRFDKNLAWLTGLGDEYRGAFPSFADAKQREADAVAAALDR